MSGEAVLLYISTVLMYAMRDMNGFREEFRYEAVS